MENEKVNSADLKRLFTRMKVVLRKQSVPSTRSDKVHSVDLELPEVENQNVNSADIPRMFTRMTVV